jgi:hypothetical protein
MVSPDWVDREPQASRLDDDRVAVAQLAGELGAGGDARDGLEELGTDKAGVPAGARGYHAHAADARWTRAPGLRPPSLAVRVLGVHAPARRAVDRLGLLEDLLLHVAGVAVLSMAPSYQVDGVGLAVDLAVLAIGDAESLWSMDTTSPSFRKTTCLVREMKAMISEPRSISPSPTPTARGLPLRAPRSAQARPRG